jgi:mRNA interferase RelE/StbE
MNIYQSGIFEKKVRKMTKKEKSALDAEIKKIADNPSIDEEKKGDLKNIFVHKFKIRALEYLLSYRLKGKNLELIMLGSHGNYYRDLKRYLK